MLGLGSDGPPAHLLPPCAVIALRQQIKGPGVLLRSPAEYKTQSPLRLPSHN